MEKYWNHEYVYVYELSIAEVQYCSGNCRFPKIRKKKLVNQLISEMVPKVMHSHLFINFIYTTVVYEDCRTDCFSNGVDCIGCFSINTKK